VPDPELVILGEFFLRQLALDGLGRPGAVIEPARLEAGVPRRGRSAVSRRCFLVEEGDFRPRSENLSPAGVDLGLEVATFGRRQRPA
jgi:hypothetical protein